MGKSKPPRKVTLGEVCCLENLVVAYNTVFLMSSIFIVSIAGTAQDLFADFSRLLSPSSLLLVIGGFIVLMAGIGYVGVGKKSTTIISLYTFLLIIIFTMELAAGLGILSYRREIKSVVTHKMKNAIAAYPNDPMTANLVDYAQLELNCCGVQNYWDWEGVFDSKHPSTCRTVDIVLPQSCCRPEHNSTAPAINSRGCLSSLTVMLHRGSLQLTTILIAVCTIQILGAYFSYSLASTLRKFKIQNEVNNDRETYHEARIPDYREKVNYF